MTRHEQKALLAVALSHYGAQTLEQKVLAYMDHLLRGELSAELPSQVSSEGLAQLVGLLLSDIEACERPMIGPLRPTNREHFRALRLLHDRLTISLMADLPAALVPTESLGFKVAMNLEL